MLSYTTVIIRDTDNTAFCLLQYI